MNSTSEKFPWISSFLMKVLLRNFLLINLQNTFWRLLLSNIHKPISEYVLFFTICGKTFWAKAFVFACYISYFIFFTVCKDKQTTDKDVFKAMSNIYNEVHCMKSVRIWSFSVTHFPAFGLNTERYSVILFLQKNAPS